MKLRVQPGDVARLVPPARVNVGLVVFILRPCEPGQFGARWWARAAWPAHGRDVTTNEVRQFTEARVYDVCLERLPPGAVEVPEGLTVPEIAR